MKYSQACIDLVKLFEDGAGFLAGRCSRLTAYQCPAGIWTIGWGSTRGVKPGMTIDAARADELLAEDLDRAKLVVMAAVNVPLTQGQLDACVSFAFNVGPGAPDRKDGFVWLKARDGAGKPRHSTLLRKINAQDSTAADEFPKWAKAAGKVLPGLVTRRAAERQLFLS